MEPRGDLAGWELFQIDLLERLYREHASELAEGIDFDRLRNDPEAWRSFRERLRNRALEERAKR